MIVNIAAHRARRVDLILHANKANPEIVKLLQRPQQIRHTAGKPVKLPHQDTRKRMLARRTHQRLELRVSFLPAGDRVLHIRRHDLQAGTGCIRTEPIILEVRTLVRRRDPEVERCLHAVSLVQVRTRAPHSASILNLDHIPVWIGEVRVGKRPTMITADDQSSAKGRD